MPHRNSMSCVAKPYGSRGPACQGSPEQHNIRSKQVAVFKSGGWETFPMHNFEAPGADYGNGSTKRKGE